MNRITSTTQATYISTVQHVWKWMGNKEENWIRKQSENNHNDKQNTHKYHLITLLPHE